MDRIFVSWTGADLVAARALVERLRVGGFDVYFSADRGDEERIAPGEEIRRELARRVGESAVFVALLSEAAFQSDYVLLEHRFAETNTAARAMRVVPTVVAPLGDAVVPGWMGGERLVGGMTSDPLENVLEDVMLSIRRTLGVPEPDVLPAGVVTMNRRQLGELKVQRPELFAAVDPRTLGRAYSDVAGDPDYRPFIHRSINGNFEQARSLREFVDDVVAKVNDRRTQEREVALHVKYFNCEMLRGMSVDQAAAWENSRTMLFVDALSVHHPEIQQVLTSVPRGNAVSKSLLLWLPTPARSLQVRDALSFTRDLVNGLVGYRVDFHRYLQFDPPGTHFRFEVGSEPGAQHCIHEFCSKLEASGQRPERPRPELSGTRVRYVGRGVPGLGG